MRDLGRIEPIDAALIALARVTADELDAACHDTDESRFTVATLAGRYLAVLTPLIARPPGDDLDSLEDLFASAPDPPQP